MGYTLCLVYLWVLSIRNRAQVFPGGERVAALGTSGGAAPGSEALDEALEADELTDTLAFLSVAACHTYRKKSIQPEYCLIKPNNCQRQNRLFVMRLFQSCPAEGSRALLSCSWCRFNPDLITGFLKLRLSVSTNGELAGQNTHCWAALCHSLHVWIKVAAHSFVVCLVVHLEGPKFIFKELSMPTTAY